MKKLALLAFIGIFVFLASNSHAQGLKIPKMDLSSQVLKVLDNTKGLKLNADQESKLKSDNKSFVDDLMKINKSGASDEDKKASFLGLKNKRTKFLTGLLGNELFQKYSGQILKGINPLNSKLGLAALAF